LARPVYRVHRIARELKPEKGAGLGPPSLHHVNHWSSVTAHPRDQGGQFEAVVTERPDGRRILKFRETLLTRQPINDYSLHCQKVNVTRSRDVLGGGFYVKLDGNIYLFTSCDTLSRSLDPIEEECGLLCRCSIKISLSHLPNVAVVKLRKRLRCQLRM